MENVTVETVLIGSMILRPEHIFNVSEIVSKDDFIDRRCMIVFEVMKDLNGKGGLALLSNDLRIKSSPGMYAFLLEIFSHDDEMHIMEHARAIKENSKQRKLKGLASDITTGNIPSEDMIKHIEGQLISLYDTRHPGFRNGKIMGADYLRWHQTMKNKGTKISGLPSGFNKLDNITDGFKPGELIIIGARPSQGKTSLMVAMSDNIAINLNKNVCIFSIESTERDIIHKFISQRACIISSKLRRGEISEDDEILFNNAIDLFTTDKLYINDVSIIDIGSMRLQIRKMCVTGHKPDIIFVDYLQIIDVDKGTHETFATKIGRVTQGLKNIAKELDIPVVTLAQINRSNEERPPRLLDLKDSGSIEAIADIAILLHREEFYKKEKCPSEKRGILDVDIAKNRNGNTALIELNWNGTYTRITEYLGG